MDHITKTPLRVNDEVAHISKSSPTIFWLKSFFPTIVKIFFRFSSFDKKNRFFQPRSKIPALVTFTWHLLSRATSIEYKESRIKRRLNLVLIPQINVANFYFNIHASFIDLPNYEQLSQEVTSYGEKASIPTFWTG